MRYKGFYFIIILAVIFIIFILFPNLSLYRNHINYKQFNIYCDTKIDDNIYKVLDEVEEKLLTSEIYDNSLNFKIFISSNFNLYSIFCPTLKDAFAATYPIINNIFISKTDIVNNLVYRNATEDNERSLSSVIVHEATHKLIENEIGVKVNKNLQTWKKEGYCEYVSGENSLNLSAGINEVYTGSNSFSSAFSYLKYRILVTYLLDVKGHTFKSLIETEFNIHNLENEFMAYRNNFF